jgi:hypothetical protein
MLTLLEAKVSALRRSQIDQFIDNMVARIARKYPRLHAHLDLDNSCANI